MPLPLLDNTQHSQESDIYDPGGIRTHNPNIGAAAVPPLRQRGHWDRQTDDSTGKNKMHSSVACERHLCTRRVYAYRPSTATYIVCDVYSAACPDTCVNVTPSTGDIQTLHWRQHLLWILKYSPTPVTKLHKHLHINILKIWQTEHATQLIFP
jgi:hypothetical protein